MKNYTLGAVVLFTALCIGSCTDYDYGFSEKSIQYDESFKSAFGEIDPNQDWIMATRVRADINLSNIPGSYKLNILTGNPANSNTRLLAQTTVVDGQASLNFDCIKGLDKVYITASKDGKYAICKEYPIVEGQLLVGNVTRGVTRAADGQANGVTKGGTQILDFGAVKDIPIWSGGQTGQTFEEYAYDQTSHGWIQEYKGSEPLYTKMNGMVVVEYNSKKYLFGAYLFDYNQRVTLQYLTGQTTSAASPWLIRDKASLFGPGMFFQEQLEYFKSPKTNLYGSDVVSMLDKIEEGFVITSTGENGGEITIPFIYGGTDNSNMLGYVYWKDGASVDPLELPHYILMDNARPADNIKKDGSSISGMTLSNLMAQTSMEDLNSNISSVVGTNYKLTFFGENYNSNGQYYFPKGYNIMFFLAPGTPNNVNTYNFAYSLPEYNKRIGKSYGHASRSANAYATTLNRQNGGAVKATAWKSNGRIYMGFEDGGQDEDLNDLVFYVEGEFDAPEIITVDPDPTPDPTPVTPVSWMFACEDLGNMDDYDFNDIVWEVVNEYDSEGTFTGAKIRMLAAGGTLPFVLKYSGQKICEKTDVYGTGHNAIMYNTGQATGEIKEYPFPVNLERPWSPTDDASKFSVEITTTTGGTSASYTVSLKGAGSAPQIILVPGGWEWPTERQKITSKYSKFADWVNNSNVDWLGNSRSSNSTTQQEATQQESTQQESTQQETTQQESTQQGSTQQETTQQGTTQQETTQPRTVTYTANEFAAMSYTLPKDMFKNASKVIIKVYENFAAYTQFSCEYDYFEIPASSDDLTIRTYTFDNNSFPPLSRVQTHGLVMRECQGGLIKIDVIIE